jgi:hypothetical protein
LLDFSERPIRELLRLFPVGPLFLSCVSLDSLDLPHINVGNGLDQTPFDKLLRCFMKRIPQLSL